MKMNIQLEEIKILIFNVSGICVVCQQQTLDLRTKHDWYIIANTLLCAGLLQKFNYNEKL